MNRRRTPIALLASVFLVVSGTSVFAAGIDWDKRRLGDVLADKAGGANELLVKIDATWCPGCRKLDEELLSKGPGVEIGKTRRAVKVDFDDQANRPIIEKYAILGLPTVLLLRPDGSEIGRIMGYESAANWLEKLGKLDAAADALPGLEARFAKDADDPGLVLKLGKLLLNRGLRQRAIAMLERMSWLPKASDAQQAESLFLLGRYFHRVRRQPNVARHVWRELATRFPKSAWAGGAWWWYARAQAELGRHDLGVRALQSRFERSGEVSHALSWAAFVTKHSLKKHTAAVKASLQAIEAGPKQAAIKAAIAKLPTEQKR